MENRHTPDRKRIKTTPYQKGIDGIAFLPLTELVSDAVQRSVGGVGLEDGSGERVGDLAGVVEGSVALGVGQLEVEVSARNDQLDDFDGLPLDGHHQGGEIGNVASVGIGPVLEQQLRAGSRLFQRY